MIQPLEYAEKTRAPSNAVCYQIVAWGNTLPAFDPLAMVKTALLSPSSVKKFNGLVFRFSRPLNQYIAVAVGLRFATFAVPASVGRVLAPITAVLHIPPILIFVAGMRLDYMKIILRTFDFGFLFAANAIWAVVFSAVLRDSRATLVVICWGNFISSLFQETNLRNTSFMVAVTLCEWLFFVMLMVWLSLELVDDVTHYTVTTAQGGEISTKDLLTNVIGTMAMLSLRNVYQRYLHLKRHKTKSGMVMRAPGYRCKVALGLPGPLSPPTCSDVMLQQVCQPTQSIIKSAIPNSARRKSSKRQLVQMHLAAESIRFDPTKTIWPRIGALTPVSAWKLAIVYGCGIVGGVFAVLSLFLPTNVYGAEVITVVALTVSIFFTAVCTCCCQRQLLKRVMTSFNFLFLSTQILAAGMCLIDMFSWRWVPTCGIISGILLAYCILSVDGLTPIMKKRLRFKYWINVYGIILFLVVMLLLLLDVLVLGNWDLQDRVFLDFALFGHRSQLRVAPFLLSRVFTIMVWSGRYVFIVLTRQDDNALILLRGNVEFDYEGWKKQTTQNSIMIHPRNDSEPSSCYQIVAWESTLPAFDPLPMTKTLLLSPSSVKVYNRIVGKFHPLVKHFVFIGLVLRFAAFALPARIGRILAPISAFLHMFGLITSAAQMRTEYATILLHTFDFWFLQTANTLCGIIFITVLRDLRVVLVIFCWADFTCWLIQETYLWNSYAIVAAALYEWVFYVFLMVALSLDLVNDVQHYALVTTSQGRLLSSKDVLVNLLGTMAMLSLRTLYIRYQQVKYQKSKPGTATPALGYRCKIELRPTGPTMAIVPQWNSNPNKVVNASHSNTATSSSRPLVQMQLAADSERFDPRNTVWRRVGDVSSLARWKIATLYMCGAMGGTFAVLSLFLPHHSYGAELIAVSGVVTSALFTGVFVSCCQRQLLKRVMTSFHFLFLWIQILALGLCVNDLFGWRWVPACGVVSSLLFAQTILTVDALTPTMKRRLQFTYWMFISGIALFLTVQSILLLDVLVLGNWNLHDRVFLPFRVFGRRAQLRVASLFFSRVITVFVWSGRYVYVALTRPDDNALIFLRGNVEFDYAGWKKQANPNPRERGKVDDITVK